MIVWERQTFAIWMENRTTLHVENLDSQVLLFCKLLKKFHSQESFLLRLGKLRKPVPINVLCMKCSRIINWSIIQMSIESREPRWHGMGWHNRFQWRTWDSASVLCTLESSCTDAWWRPCSDAPTRQEKLISWLINTCTTTVIFGNSKILSWGRKILRQFKTIFMSSWNPRSRHCLVNWTMSHISPSSKSTRLDFLMAFYAISLLIDTEMERSSEILSEDESSRFSGCTMNNSRHIWHL